MALRRFIGVEGSCQCAQILPAGGLGGEAPNRLFRLAEVNLQNPPIDFSVAALFGLYGYVVNSIYSVLP